MNELELEENLKKYSFFNLVSDLISGREIEFKYNGDLYGITYNSEYWCFSNDSKKTYEKIIDYNRELPDSVLKKSFENYFSTKIINGNSVEYIFNNNLFYSLFIY